MKPGMTVIEKRRVGDRWVWIAEGSSVGQDREWATYVSTSPDANQTEHGRYFANYSNAIRDFDARIKQYFPTPLPVQSENGWAASFEARRGIYSGGTDIYLLCSLADGSNDCSIYNDQHDDIYEIRDRLTGMDADTFDVDLVLRGKPISIKLYKACDWSWWAYFGGKHKKLRISWRTEAYEVVHLITEIDGDRLFRS